MTFTVYLSWFIFYAMNRELRRLCGFAWVCQLQDFCTKDYDILGQFIFSGYLPYIYNGKTNLVPAILEENFLTTKYGAKNIMQTVT